MEKSYSIGDVSRISGVTEKQIRNWERQDYIPLQDRIVCGNGGRTMRIFSEKQLKLITKIRELLNVGFTLPVAAVKAAQYQQKEEK